MVGTGDPPDLAVLYFDIPNEGVIDAQHGRHPGSVAPGPTWATPGPAGPFGDSIVEESGQAPVCGPHRSRVEIADEQGWPGRLPQLRLQRQHLLATLAQRRGSVDGVGEMDAPDGDRLLGDQSTSVRQRYPPNLQRETSGYRRAGVVERRRDETVGKTVGDHFGGIRRQFLGRHHVGTHLVEKTGERGRIGATVVQVGREDPKHESVMVCEYWDMSFGGRLLVATPLITDPHFFHTVVYLYAHDPDEGAAGVVLNRPTEEPTVEHLPGWRSHLAAPPNIFWGGPVAEANGLVLLVADGEVRLADDLDPPMDTVRARLFVGQAGWAPGQLEAEIAEGAWVVTDPLPDDIVSPFPDRLWSRVLRRVGGEAAVWSTHPVDVRMN